jgi:arylsulfatase A-like enzyme
MPSPPNIVLILADDMGYGDFGCFNGGISQTPAIDQLVAEGMCLTQHYSASPVCAPARASLLTGRWKLVRPAIAELMAVSAEDFAMDVDAKYSPDSYRDILRDLPARPVSSAAMPSQLFDLESDPEERHDRAAEYPDRVVGMERDLSRWFEAVEAERRALPTGM